MTRVALLPCPRCSRHVRTTESACPFCSLALPASLRPVALARPPRPQRRSRAALYAVGAGTLAANVACSNTIVPYGLPPFDDGGHSSVQDAGAKDATTDQGATVEAGQDAAATDAADGGSILPDSCLESADDAGSEDATPDRINVVPPYGLPP
jgi:hypothetical protein